MGIGPLLAGAQKGLSTTTGRTILASLSVGLAAAATGGNFVIGAMAAANVHLYNVENGAQGGNAPAIPDAQVAPEDREALAKFERLASDASREVDASCSVVCETPWLGPVSRELTTAQR